MVKTNVLEFSFQVDLHLTLKNVEDQKCHMDDLIVQHRNKECMYWSNNWSILVNTLVMGVVSFNP